MHYDSDFDGTFNHRELKFCVEEYYNMSVKLIKPFRTPDELEATERAEKEKEKQEELEGHLLGDLDNMVGNPDNTSQYRGIALVPLNQNTIHNPEPNRMDAI